MWLSNGQMRPLNENSNWSKYAFALYAITFSSFGCGQMEDIKCFASWNTSMQNYIEYISAGNALQSVYLPDAKSIRRILWMMWISSVHSGSPNLNGPRRSTLWTLRFLPFSTTGALSIAGNFWWEISRKNYMKYCRNALLGNNNSDI